MIFTTSCQKEAKENKQLLIQDSSTISKQKTTSPTTITTNTNTGFKVLSKEMFGIKLGEHFENVEKKYNLTREDKYSDDGIDVYRYDFSSKSIKKSTVTFWKNQVLGIEVYLVDSSYSNYRGVAKRIGEKYNTRVDCISKSTSTTANIDGEEVYISLARDEPLNYGELIIHYSYKKMGEHLLEESEKKKSSGVADDL